MERIELFPGLSVSTQGFGGMALTDVYGGVDQEQALRTLHHAVDAGVTFIDTADVYGQGRNEELISGLLAARRQEVQLATKFGITGDATGAGRRARGDAAYVRQAAEASLRRLGTDVIDLYYLHRRDTGVPLEETVGAMAALVQEGKVRFLGLSEVTADELSAACKVHPIAAVQSEWSIWSRDVENHVVPAAARLGAGFVPYSPLGRGFLTGTVAAGSLAGDDFRHSFPRFSPQAMAANAAVVEAVQSVALDTEATPAQVALAWLSEQGRKFGLPVVPIPGTRRPERVDENAAAENVRLSAANLDVLDAAADLAVGERSADPEWVSKGREQ
jgi:aryl-alcohol dehydrogenase-like predicted oxidoreductase